MVHNYTFVLILPSNFYYTAHFTYLLSKCGDIAFRMLLILLRIVAAAILTLQVVPAAHFAPVNLVWTYIAKGRDVIQSPALMSATAVPAEISNTRYWP